MRRILAGCLALVAVSWLAAGCSSGSSNGGSGGASASGGSNGGTSGGKGGAAGGGLGGAAGDPNADCNVGIMAMRWLSDVAACNTCQQKNCCAKIVACAGNNDCLGIYKCEQNCYDGIGPDGGAVASDDAGTDDAMNTAMDRCVNDCKAAGTPAGLALYTPQDECVNGDVCGAVDVCN